MDTLLQELHNKYKNHQDKKIDSFLNNPFHLQIDESRTPLTMKAEVLKENQTIFFNFNMWPDGKEIGKRYALKNIRILNSSNLEIGDKLILTIGGIDYDRIFILFENDKKEFPFSLSMNNNLFPGILEHHIRLYYEYVKDNNISIEYTLVPILEFEEGFENIFITHYYSKLENEYLQLYCPIKEINLYTSNNVSEGYLLIEEDRALDSISFPRASSTDSSFAPIVEKAVEDTYKLPLTKTSENHWNITFQDNISENNKTINFTKLKCKVVFSEDPGNTTCMAKFINMSRIYMNMAGLCFFS